MASLEFQKMIREGSKVVARKTYNELIEVTTVLRITNPLFTDDDICDKMGFVTQACVYEICRLMGWDEEEDFYTICEALFEELTFDELLEKFSELEGDV